MSALKTFLKEQAHAQRATQAERMEAIAEWKQALNSLIEQLERWLHEADPKNVLKVERIPITIRERCLGIYEVDGLRVWLKYRDFRVEPGAATQAGRTARMRWGTRSAMGWSPWTAHIKSTPSIDARRKAPTSGRSLIIGPTNPGPSINRPLRMRSTSS